MYGLYVSHFACMQSYTTRVKVQRLGMSLAIEVSLHYVVALAWAK